MTERFHSFIVVMEKDIREDDAESVMMAMRHIRGVISVAGVPSTPDSYMAVQRARSELREQLWDTLYPKHDR